jgi:hypothetical protein
LILDSGFELAQYPLWMITEWQIQSFSRRCASTGRPFVEGDHVLCLLVDSMANGLCRMDVLESESASLTLDGPIVGRWARIIKAPEASGAQDRKQETRSVEELFLSMVESVPLEARSNSTRCMVYLLALFLERKRVLKGIPAKGIPQHYLVFRHIKTKTDHWVEQVEMTPENLAHIENNLNLLSGESEEAESDPNNRDDTN